MGGGSWTSKSWDTYASSHVTSKKSVKEVYTSRGMDPSLDPKGLTVRESRDSVDSPESTAIIVGADVTGSMDPVLNSLIRTALPVLTGEIYPATPPINPATGIAFPMVTNPHLMFLGIGDVEAGDRAPLQVTQFEADIRIAEQLTKIYLEGNGGSNNYESYALAWYLAGMHTSIDCFEKRKKKGYLFTIGDEEPTPYLRGCDIERVFGYKPQFDKITADDLLTLASRSYEVYHIMVEEGHHFRHSGDNVAAKWGNLLGQRAMRLSDISKLAEIITSAIYVNEGASREAVINRWDGSTGIVVARAITEGAITPVSSATGVVKF